MPHGEAADPSIMKALDDPYNPEEIEWMCAYLDMGIPLAICCGTSQDIVHPENGVDGIPSMLTDGIWVWPGDLSYYVNRYKVRLSEEFIAHMRENDWQVKIDTRNIENEHIEVGNKSLW